MVAQPYSDASRKCAARLSHDSSGDKAPVSTGGHEPTAKGWSVGGVCMPSTPKCAVRLAYLLGDGCACSHMQADDSMSDAYLTRKATAANLTRWQDHEEVVVARVCTARHSFQAIQPANPERVTARAQRQQRWHGNDKASQKSEVVSRLNSNLA